VVAEDTDILVLLLHGWSDQMADVHLVSEAKRGRGEKIVPPKCINIPEFHRHLGEDPCKCLPAVHAFGGCDTTSAIYGHGKGSVYSRLVNDDRLKLNTAICQCYP
jgi:hypothetical protein